MDRRRFARDKASMPAARGSRRRGPVAFLAVLTAVIAAVVVTSGDATSIAATREYSTAMSSPAGPNGITAGPDGNVWFTEAYADRIGRITPAGVVSEYPPTAAIQSVRLRAAYSVGVRLRCPSGAARDCRGTLHLLGRPDRRLGVRRFALAPGRRAEVIVPLWAAGRRQLRVQGKLPLAVVLVPSAHSGAGAVVRNVVLRLPRLPAVAG